MVIGKFGPTPRPAGPWSLNKVDCRLVAATAFGGTVFGGTVFLLACAWAWSGSGEGSSYLTQLAAIGALALALSGALTSRGNVIQGATQVEPRGRPILRC